VRKDVILEDRNFEFVRFGQSFFPSPYPYWIKIGGDGLGATSAITSKLGTISLPWASAIDIDTTQKDSSKIEILASSSKGSWEEANSFFLLPRDLKEFLPVNQRAYPLAVLKSGKLRSFYADRALPIGDSIQPLDTTGFARVAKKEARMLVIGNALFATDFYVGYTQGVSNLHMLLNSFDQLALDPDLITIRSRAISNSPIEEGKKARKIPIVLLNLLFAPGLLLVAGIVIGIRRKNREDAA
jgi:hypothetical protein